MECEGHVGTLGRWSGNIVWVEWEHREGGVGRGALGG